MTVRRIFVEKRQGFFDIPAQQLRADLTESFGLTGLKAVRIIHRYDIEGLSEEEYEAVKSIVFSEPPVDVVYEDSKYNVDVTISNHELPKTEFGSWSVRELYKRKL